MFVRARLGVDSRMPSANPLHCPSRIDGRHWKEIYLRPRNRLASMSCFPWWRFGVGSYSYRRVRSSIPCLPEGIVRRVIEEEVNVPRRSSAPCCSGLETFGDRVCSLCFGALRQRATGREVGGVRLGSGPALFCLAGVCFDGVYNCQRFSNFEISLAFPGGTISSPSPFFTFKAKDLNEEPKPD